MGRLYFMDKDQQWVQYMTGINKLISWSIFILFLYHYSLNTNTRNFDLFHFDLEITLYATYLVKLSAEHL